MSFSGYSGIDRCFQIGCVFVEYDLFITTNLIQNLTYMRVGIILTQYNIHFLRQEHQIELNQLLIFSGFRLFTRSFFLYSPFKHLL